MQLPPLPVCKLGGANSLSTTALTYVWYTTFSNVLAITDVTLMSRKSEFSLGLSIFGTGFMFALFQESGQV